MRSAALFTLLGLALCLFLLATNDLRQIASIVSNAGWFLAVVVALHLPQTWISASAWRIVVPPPTPGMVRSYLLRWVRDSINTLLPVAQVGGDVARIRLTVREGSAGPPAITSATLTDVSLEVVGQIVFTLAAVLLLMLSEGNAPSAVVLAWTTSLGCLALLGILLGAHRFGLFERLKRLAARRLPLGAEAAIATDVSVVRASNRQLAWSFLAHVAAWAFGGVETWAALWAIGVSTSFTAATVIEALGHVARAVGFFIPGALGVQEGGLVLVCGLYGIGPAEALSLSVVKRLRELALGMPGLFLWGWMERR